MRLLHGVALVVALSATAASAVDLGLGPSKITICNKVWNPQCRDFPVVMSLPNLTAALPMPTEKLNDQDKYSIQLNDLTKNELVALLTALGVDENKVDLNSPK